jgi:acid phosphatase
VFYVSNRTADEETATRKNLEKFARWAAMSTMLMRRKQLTGAPRRDARVRRPGHRILINVGDNFGDFVDDYRGGEAERLKVMEDNKARWGREWIMIANPSYGSFESAPYRHDFQLSDGEKRTLKRGVLDAWPGP